MNTPDNQGKDQSRANTSSAKEQALLEQIQAQATRIDALEEFLANFLVVLESENRRGFTAERMNAWLTMCTKRMETTGSATHQQIKALRRLQEVVLG